MHAGNEVNPWWLKGPLETTKPVHEENIINLKQWFIWLSS